jgi:hypothetical protein
MVPKIMLEGGHAWVHERPIAAGAAAWLHAAIGRWASQKWLPQVLILGQSASHWERDLAAGSCMGSAWISRAQIPFLTSGSAATAA